MKENQSKPVDLSPENVKKTFEELFTNRKQNPPMGITIYTGIGGVYMFDYALAEQTGMITPHMTKKHARFVRLMGMSLHKAVDENGIVWMIGKVKGKGYHFSNMHQKAPTHRPLHARFTNWEYSLSQGWPTVYLGPGVHESYAYFREKRRLKMEAKATGQRIKGTRYDDKEWQAYYHGY